MSDIALKVEDVSKQYRLGTIGTGTLSHDLNRWFAKVRGKEDPFLKIGETNDRTTSGGSDFVWALKDINFEIKKGDVVGIIGRNGAGKSTLLKLLSKTTLPTTGRIKINGRIASLLEVGTGFHPELTGRDNIYLNGAILGMTKREIQSKFDEIVDFAGVARYVDTPVKRYSSGMYVRLAFAVAAHLDPDILIVDEVLAVGDAEFQKKAIGKMKSVSEEGGRTVLFVSHNMAAMKSLCNHGVLMKNGQMVFQSGINDAIFEYQKGSATNSSFVHNGSLESAFGNNNIRLLAFTVEPYNNDKIDIATPINVRLSFYNYSQDINLDATFELRTNEEQIVFHSGALLSTNKDSKIGEYTIEFQIPGNLLNAGNYYFKLFFGKDQSILLLGADNLIGFEVENIRVGVKTQIYPGVIRPDFDYKINFK